MFKKRQVSFKKIFWSFFLIIYDLKVKIASKIKNKKNKSDNIKINFVYFSCKKHFKHFVQSLKSLKKINFINIGKIFLYIDKKYSLSKYQLLKLKKIIPNVILKKTKFKNKQGPRRIINYLIAYKEISQQIGSKDYLAKVDSDILFFSDSILKTVIKSKAKLIGQPILCWFKFVQGGCYFLNNSILPYVTSSSIYKIVKETCKRMNWNIDDCPDDAFIFLLLKRKTNNIQFEKFYLPLEDFKKIKKDFKKKYSVIHFEGLLTR